VSAKYLYEILKYTKRFLLSTTVKQSVHESLCKEVDVLPNWLL